MANDQSVCSSAGRVCSMASILTIVVCVSVDAAEAGERKAKPQAAAIRKTETPAERGYRLLRTKPYLPPDFDQEVFDNLWKLWPEPLRSEARDATPARRRTLAFSRYGLMEPPDNPRGRGPALGYLDDGQGGWVMNCLACHAGKVAGRVIPGLPNTHFALQTLTEEVRLTKIPLRKQFSHMDLGSLKIPLGSTIGTTNSVMFGVALGALRDREMNVRLNNPSPRMQHHDMDAPPLWNVKKKTKLYADGFSPKNARVLLQFLLLPRNSGKTIKGWEDDYQDILAWIESLEPPKYPWKIDRPLAENGKPLFVKHCSRCHGTYGKDGVYRQRIIPIDVVGTDAVRLRALTRDFRRKLHEGWLSHYGRDEVILDPNGYVAPPLDGIWASAPYLHNGSVPTLWHLLHPEQRPTIWRRKEQGYDRERGGLEVTVVDGIPSAATTAERRHYFDTRRPSKSAAGHLFPNALDETEKRAVLEYLKTL